MNENRAAQQPMPHSYLIDNIKIVLIYLVVFNHLIAFQLVKEDELIRRIWYAVTVFHMPAFIFVSGFLSRRPQYALKNAKNLLIPYILGYSLTWWAQVFSGSSLEYDLLRPSGTAMWYLLALFVYRVTAEAFGRVRFVIPLSILLALWAGTRPEFGTYLSLSRIVVFFPFFAAGYLWKDAYTKKIRRFKGKGVLLLLPVFLLYAVPSYMIGNDRPVDIFRGNHSYEECSLGITEGIVIRLLMYLISFLIILAFLALLPDKKTPLNFVGRNTRGTYFFHYPILIVMNGMGILALPQLLNGWVLAVISLLFVLILGSLPANILYNGSMYLAGRLIFRQEKTAEPAPEDKI